MQAQSRIALHATRCLHASNVFRPRDAGRIHDELVWRVGLNVETIQSCVFQFLRRRVDGAQITEQLQTTVSRTFDKPY